MNCPLCSNSSTLPALSGRDVLFATSSREFNLNACPVCRCMFLNPLPADDEIAGFYPEQYWWSGSSPSLLKRLESVYRRIALHDHISFIKRAALRLNVASPPRLLDVGCGSATLLGLLKRRGFDVVGVDTSHEASRVAAAEHAVRVVTGTLHQAEFDTSEFDIVTLFHVMEHVTNPRDLLGEVRRVLKPDGVVILQVPNIDSWQFRWFGAKWYGLDIPRHVIDYSRGAMVWLLEASGFRIDRIRHFNFRDNAPALVSSLLPSLDPLSRPIRLRRRGVTEPVLVSWGKHLAYLALVVLAYPVAMLEAICGHGATVMIEARKR